RNPAGRDYVPVICLNGLHQFLVRGAPAIRIENLDLMTLSIRDTGKECQPIGNMPGVILRANDRINDEDLSHLMLLLSPTQPLARSSAARSRPSCVLMDARLPKRSPVSLRLQ